MVGILCHSCAHTVQGGNAALDDGMNLEEIRASRARLRLTIRDGAFLIGVEPRTWERWEQGTRAVPAPVERLLWAFERDPTLMDHLRDMAVYSALGSCP